MSILLQITSIAALAALLCHEVGAFPEFKNKGYLSGYAGTVSGATMRTRHPSPPLAAR